MLPSISAMSYPTREVDDLPPEVQCEEIFKFAVALAKIKFEEEEEDERRMCSERTQLQLEMQALRDGMLFLSSTASVYNCFNTPTHETHFIDPWNYRKQTAERAGERL